MFNTHTSVKPIPPKFWKLAFSALDENFCCHLSLASPFRSLALTTSLSASPYHPKFGQLYRLLPLPTLSYFHNLMLPLTCPYHLSLDLLITTTVSFNKPAIGINSVLHLVHLVDMWLITYPLLNLAGLSSTAARTSSFHHHVSACLHFSFVHSNTEIFILFPYPSILTCTYPNFYVHIS